MILDTAGAKGTGKWMSQLALDLGVPSTLVTEAVYARSLSALKDERVAGEPACCKGPERSNHIEAIARRSSSRAAGSLRLEDLQLRAGLRATRGRGQGTQVAARTSATSPCCGAAAASSGPLPGSHQRSVRRRREIWKTCSSPPTSQRRSNKRRIGLAARRRDGDRAAASRCRRSRRPWPTTTASAAVDCRPICCKPSATTSAPHLSAHRPARHVPQRLAPPAADAGDSEMIVS